MIKENTGTDPRDINPDPNSGNQQEVTKQLWAKMNPSNPAMLVTMSQDLKKAFIKGYKKDLQF